MRTPLLSRVLAVASLSLVAGLSTDLNAQVTTRGRLIGYTASSASPSTTPPLIQRQLVCSPTERVCPTGVGGPGASWAGGFAYDGSRVGYWVTQGTRIAGQRLGDCGLDCSFPATLSLGTGSLASGLAYDETTRTLYQLETRPGAAALNQFSTIPCPPRFIDSCRFPLPSNRHVAGAVAIDQRSGYVFYGTSVVASATGALAADVILVAQLSNPCNIVCRIPARDCSGTPMRGIRGMAYDDCAQALYVTDGSKTIVFERTGLGPCDFNAIRCCDIGPANNSLWYGLDIEAIHAEEIGDSCAGPGCRNCPDMRLVAIGDPVVGNTGFGLRIENGPSGARAFLAFNIGRCRPQALPFLCGPYYPALNPPPASLGIGTLTGPGCAAQVSLRVPVPNDYSLCGGALCFQGILVCPNTPVPGLSLTNGLQVVVDA